MDIKSTLLHKRELLLKLSEQIKNERMEEDVVTITYEKDTLDNSIIAIPAIKTIYRLHHIEYLDIRHGSSGKATAMRDYISKPFILPEGMSKEDAFKVLSYFTDYLESNLGIEEGSLHGVTSLSKVLDLERFGFKRVKCDNNDIRIKDLFTIYGSIERFRKSKYRSRYFEWYTENVTREEVESIYNKIGMDFSDIVIHDNTKTK